MCRYLGTVNPQHTTDDLTLGERIVDGRAQESWNPADRVAPGADVDRQPVRRVVRLRTQFHLVAVTQPIQRLQRAIWVPRAALRGRGM